MDDILMFIQKTAEAQTAAALGLLMRSEVARGTAPSPSRARPLNVLLLGLLGG